MRIYRRSQLQGIKHGAGIGLFMETSILAVKIKEVNIMKLKCLKILSIFLVLGLWTVSFTYSADPVVIGLQGPITGPWAYEGQMAKQSCEIAADLINSRGGILGGRKVEVRVVDDEGQPRTGALAATKLVGQKDVVAAVSTYGSSVCEPASNIYEKAKKVNIAYGATAVRLSDRGLKYFFRTCGRDDSQGKFFTEVAMKKFNSKRIAIMHDNTAFGKGLAEDTQNALKPMIDDGQITIVYFDAITPGERDFRVPLTKLRGTDPDLWYFTGYYAEAALLLSQARGIGITVPFVGGNAAINDEFVKIAGIDVAKGAFMTNEPLPGDLAFDETRDFLAAYKAKFGEIPSSPWPLYAADALKIIAYAIDKTGSTDSDVLAEYLRKEADGVPGITGSIGFTDQGDREGVPFYLYVVNDEGQIVVSD
jgi:branched-chain amino acid transport system substrate-binding protein